MVAAKVLCNAAAGFLEAMIQMNSCCNWTITLETATVFVVLGVIVHGSSHESFP